jgi:hypothetical protein
MPVIASLSLKAPLSRPAPAGDCHQIKCHGGQRRKAGAGFGNLIGLGFLSS